MNVEVLFEKRCPECGSEDVVYANSVNADGGFADSRSPGRDTWDRQVLLFICENLHGYYFHSPQASYGENREQSGNPDCRCRPSCVLMWELSEAIVDDCPVHGLGVPDPQPERLLLT